MRHSQGAVARAEQVDGKHPEAGFGECRKILSPVICVHKPENVGFRFRVSDF